MITEDMLLGFMRESAYKPMTYQELEQHFGIEDAEVFREFMNMLNGLEEAGEIVLTRTQRYGVPERMDLLRGRLQTHAKGFGFLIPENREHPDVYINANDMLSAMNGDTVLVRIASRGSAGGRMEGEIVRVVKRAITQIVGTYQDEESFGFVLPDDKRITRDIFIPAGRAGSALNGQKVVVRIISYPEGRAAAQGEVIEVLGYNSDPGVDILSIIRKHQLPESFPDEVLAEAEAAPESLSEEEIGNQIANEGRRDLRNKQIVTIDGEDAKDLDDAVNVERLENGNYVLGVHIADVGYYVKESSALDQEAYNRGSSVYLVDRVIPMLPPRLSNGICSLNPRVDRLTLSCEMEFDASMRVIRYDIFKSVIKTVERMTYKNVRRILEEEDPELLERYGYLVDNFRTMRDLALKLNARRMKRGAVDFDFEEAKVLLDDQGKAIDIVKRERSIAERIIEEFMLAANETVAEHFTKAKTPFLYRVHEDPDQEKLKQFMAFAESLGFHVKGKAGTVQPRELQSLLSDVQETPEQKAISTLLLRSMKQARYDAADLGHFGLAADFYTHFTSPIRRYPDLAIHRVIGEVLAGGGKLTPQREEALAARMPDYAQQSSVRERVAVDAERDTDQLKKAEYMLDKVGETFDGVVGSVTSFGLFVELENTIEGLIHISNLTDDYYHYDEGRLQLTGERTSRTFRIGDVVEIRVSKVSMDEHTIDFELVDMKKSNFRGGGRGRRAEGEGSSSGGRGGKFAKTGKEKFGKDKGKGKGKKDKDKKKDKKQGDVFRPNEAASGGAASGGQSGKSAPADAARGGGAAGEERSGSRRKRKGKGASASGEPGVSGGSGQPPQEQGGSRKRKGGRGAGSAGESGFVQAAEQPGQGEGSRRSGKRGKSAGESGGAPSPQGQGSSPGEGGGWAFGGVPAESGSRNGGGAEQGARGGVKGEAPNEARSGGKSEAPESGASSSKSEAPNTGAKQGGRRGKGGGIHIEAGQSGADVYNGSPGEGEWSNRPPGAAGGKRGRGGARSGSGGAGANVISGSAEGVKEPGKGRFGFGSGTGGYGGETASFSRDGRSPRPTGDRPKKNGGSAKNSTAGFVRKKNK
ncbi:ribonuclease R [Saccharibacillus sp. CPCC 101409]|uniref:ribonuclease R n=1 Tax=Saccharibacillus sp. CPCC 101409 TaxID=3058041 RepID=UPI0026740FD6|nr:ribonuclease R [Saccharibacillus sp. CPCC 101409]MDO3411477.1 ribonuclease R [Saccharibacillus sp. CPCC 101409]